jgi:hypothetical protein
MFIGTVGFCKNTADACLQELGFAEPSFIGFENLQFVYSNW